MSFAKRTAVTIGANGALGILGFASGTLAARLLGPTGRGELAAIQTWASFIAVVATLGLPEAIVWFCSRDPLHGGRYISTIILVGLIGCAPMLALGYVAMPLLLAAQKPAVVWAARWYLAIAIFYVLSGGPWGALQSLPDLSRWNAIRVVVPALWIGVLGVAFLIGRVTPNFLALANLIVLGFIALPIFLW